MSYFIATIIAMGIMAIVFLISSKKGQISGTCAASNIEKENDVYCEACSTVVKSECAKNKN